MTEKGKFLSEEEFQKGLENFVMPTFDFIIEIENKGILILYRKISPYKDVWALPGLRQRKGETRKNVLERILKSELGLTMEINPEELFILGQYDGIFPERQDISTGLLLKLPETTQITPNPQHFSESKFITSKDQIPEDTGEMYKYYLNKYLQFKITQYF